MGQISELQTLLLQLSERLGIAPIQLDADGYCCVSFDEVILNIETDKKRDEILIYAELLELPALPQVPFLLRILEVNYASLLLSPGGIGVDTNARKVMFVERIPLMELSFEAFEKSLQSIVDRVESLQHFMRSPGFLQPTAEGESVDEEAMRDETFLRI